MTVVLLHIANQNLAVEVARGIREARQVALVIRQDSIVASCRYQAVSAKKTKLSVNSLK